MKPLANVQLLAKGPGDAPSSDGEQENEVDLANAEKVKGDFNGVCGSPKKMARHRCKVCLVGNAKQSGSGSGSGSGKNVAHVARIDTLMLNDGKSSWIKLLNGTRI